MRIRSTYRMARQAVGVAAVSACFTMTQPACAQITFPIHGYRVQGNTLLSDQRIADTTQPFQGEDSDFETIQRALEALEKAYLASGYGSVRVEVPEQELDGGIVTLQVVEGVLGQVVVEPNEFFDADNILHSLPSLQPGKAVNIFELNRNITLANDGGSKVSNVTFKRSANNQDVDVNVKVVAENPERWLALVDDSGSASTGQYRTGLIYQNANVLNRDHAVSVQLLTSPDHVRQVGILGVSYRIPLYHLGGVLDFSASRSNVDSGQVAQAGGGPDLAISGSGTIAGVRYTHNLDASAEWQHKLSIGLENRAYGNSVTPANSSTGASLVPSLLTRPLTLGYTGSWQTPARDVSLSAVWLKNIPGGTNGSTEDFNQPGGRTGANASFQTLKLGVQHTERLPGQWSLRTAATLQITNDLLISPEQFGVGGADSVRGFSDREVAGDQGLRLSAELWAAPVDRETWRFIPLCFADAGLVKRNQPLASELAEQTISSVGLGLRAAYGKHVNARVDWGYVTQGQATVAGSNKFQTTVVFIF